MNVTVNLMVRIPSILDKLTQIITQNVRDWKFPSFFGIKQGISFFLYHNTNHKTDVLLYHIIVSLVKATHTIKPLSIISDPCITLLPKSKMASSQTRNTTANNNRGRFNSDKTNAFLSGLKYDLLALKCPLQTGQDLNLQHVCK